AVSVWGIVPLGESNEECRDIELAAYAEMRELVLAEREEIGVLAEDHAATLGLDAPRHDVEQGRLAGAVGADDDPELATVHEEVEAAQRLEAVVVHRDVFEVDDAGGASGLIGRRRWRHGMGRPSETLGVETARSDRRDTSRR